MENSRKLKVPRAKRRKNETVLEKRLDEDHLSLNVGKVGLADIRKLMKNLTLKKL